MTDGRVDTPQEDRAKEQSGHLAPRRLIRRSPGSNPAGPTGSVRPRQRPKVEPPPIAMGERFVRAVEDLAGAPHSLLLEAAEWMAAEVGCTMEEALEAITGIIDAKAARQRAAAEAAQAGRFRRGGGLPRQRRETVQNIAVAAKDLKPGDVLVEPPFAGETVRGVSLSRSGTGAVVLLEGRDDDDAWPRAKWDTVRIKRKAVDPGG